MQKPLLSLLNLVVLLALLGGGFTPPAARPTAAPAAPAPEAAATAAYDKVGLSFEQNVGQVDAQVRYLARTADYTVFLTDQQTTVVYRQGRDATAPTAILRYGLAGATMPQPQAAQVLPGKINYFMGRDPANWHTDVPTYGRVEYTGVYKGVDLVYYGTQGALQYDFNVAAGADPGQIRMTITGADRLEVADGQLLMHTAAGAIRQSAPVIYQEGVAGREPVSGGFALQADGTVGFSLGRYDASRPLTIDPATLVWSTYLGGDISANRTPHGGDWGVAMAVDSAGNPIFAGATDAVDYPLVNAPPQVPAVMHNFFCFAITKLNTTATAIVYSTFIGGTRDSNSGNGENSNGMDIALDSSNRPYVIGWTNDDTFPVTAGVVQTTKGNPGQHGRGNNAADAAIVRLNAAGNNLDWSTFYGGALNDYGYGIALGTGANPDVYLYGATRSADLPTTTGAYDTSRGGTVDAFVARLNNTATSRLYSTYLGGGANEAEIADELYGGGNPEDTFYHGGGIGVDSAGGIYVGGWTESNDFPTPNGRDTTFTGTRDGFLVKINPAGGGATDLAYGTYLGTAGLTEVRDLAVNGVNDPYVAGRTEGITTTAGAYQTTYAGNGDAFVARYNTANSGATSLRWASYLGGAAAVNANFPSEAVYGIALNSSGSVFLTGLAGSDFPTTADRYQAFAQGATGTVEPIDAFLSVLDSTGTALIYSTFLGGREEDWGSGIAVDASNCAYLNGSTLSGNHPNPPRPPEGAPFFPTTAGVVFPTYQGGKMDAWMTKLCVSGPTGVEVGHPQVVALGKGGVALNWTTASEWKHVGFIVERAGGLNTRFVAVSKLLRPGPGGGYSFVDAQGTAAMRYRLVAVDERGHRDVGTPFTPSVAKDAAAPGAPVGATNNSVTANVAPVLLAPSRPLPLGTARLVVPGAGIVRVTYEQLAAAGLSLAGFNPDLLLLTSGPAAKRSAVPIALATATAGVFAPGDYFDFVAPEARTPYADGTAYYLTIGAAPGPRMALTGNPNGAGTQATAFPATLTLEENHTYWAAAPHLGAPQAEGPWFWSYALTDQPAVVTLAVPDVAAGHGTTLNVGLQGFINDQTTNGYHSVQLRLNGTNLTPYTWYGSDLTTAPVDVPMDLLHSGNNALQVVIDNSYSPLDGVYLNSVDVRYTRRYTAAGDRLSFTTSGRAVQVGGFSSPALVAYDITSPGAPLQVRVSTVAAGGSYSLRYTTTTNGKRSVVAAGPGGLLAPASIRPIVQTDYNTGRADYVIIAHDNLLGAAEQLAAYHSAHGLVTSVVPVSAIYDQFGNGLPDPAAIRAFLDVATHWATAPRYAVLLGAASVDPHNYLGLGLGDLVPTGYSTTSYSGRTASDAALLPANGAPALGRLPAHTAAEATAVVNKLVGYMSTGHTWTTSTTLLADAADEGRFDVASESLAAVLGSTSTERLYESQYGGTTATRLIQAFNSGRALINFYGHGSANQWGTGDLFDNSRLPLLNNAGREVFVTGMTCHNGDYDWAFGNSTLTALVLQPSGGAIGALGATAASQDASHRQLAEAFYSRVLAGDRLGDALRAGLAATSDPDVRAQFTLLGDPALHVDLSR